MKQDRIAVFDIDGTIFRSSLIVELVEGLIENKIFPKTLLKEIEEDYVNWVNRQGSYNNYINSVVAAYQKYIVGCSEELVIKTAREVIDFQKDKIYVFTRELINKLKKENYFFLAISGSPEIIVSEFAKALGFDKYYGSRYIVKNGKFTGEAHEETVWKKHEILNNFILEHKEFNLDKSLGVGDSEIDITFLNLVGEPIAFNPDIKLAKYAKENGWKIVVERKNVVYKINDFDFELTS